MGDLAVRRHYDELSAAYDRDRNHRFFARGVERYLATLGPRPGRVLEVGCGTGGYLAELRRRGVDAFGVDYSPRMVESARAKLVALGLDGEALVRCADVEESTGFAERFDAVVLMDCWEFLPRPERAVATVHAALVPGGRMAIFTPNQTFRLPLTALEVLRIKKLRPAFMFRNSSVRRVLALTAGRFRLLERGTLFLGLESWFVFQRLDD